MRLFILAALALFVVGIAADVAEACGRGRARGFASRVLHRAAHPFHGGHCR